MMAKTLGWGTSVPSIPFTIEHCHLALRIKEAGLSWEPQVGCFVWDKDGRIEAPSPFGKGIYFILDMRPFLRRLGTTAVVAKDLVWLPSLHQALWICDRLAIEEGDVSSVFLAARPTDGSRVLLELYRRILRALEQALEIPAQEKVLYQGKLHGVCGPLDNFEACPRGWETDLPHQLRNLFSSRRLAVLATETEGKPYASLVAFAASDDLKTIVFATTRSTRKFAYLSTNPSVALLIDDRTNEVADFRNAMAVTATGTAQEINANRNKRLLRLYLEKHPYLKEFVSSPTCAVVKVNVRTYYAVRQFQRVFEFHVG